jgi:hypothetical protein
LPEPRNVVYFDCPDRPKEVSTKLLKLLKYESSLSANAEANKYFGKTTKEEKDVDVNTEQLSSF